MCSILPHAAEGDRLAGPNMKRVWIVSHYASTPQEKGGLTRHYSLAREMKALGWQATIIAANTSHPSGQPRPDRPPWQLCARDEVEFIYVPVPPYRGNGAARMVNMFAYSARLASTRRLKRLAPPDVIVGSSPHPGAALAAGLLARRHRVPLVYEVRDLWPQALVDMGRLDARSTTARLMYRAEEWLFRRATRTIALWPNIGGYLRDRQLDLADPVWIPNGIDPAAWSTSPRSHDAEGPLKLMYFGAHGGANGVDTVIRAMRIVQDRLGAGAATLQLIGDGPLKASLQALALQIGAGNVEFMDPVAKARIPQLAAKADAFVFSLVPAPMFRYGISPNKLYDYMAAARPIIFCCKAFNDPVTEAGAGLSVAPGDPLALADAIVELISLPRETRDEMGLAARRFVLQNHTYGQLATRFTAVLEDCLTEWRSRAQPAS